MKAAIGLGVALLLACCLACSGVGNSAGNGSTTTAPAEVAPSVGRASDAAMMAERFVRRRMRDPEGVTFRELLPEAVQTDGPDGISVWTVSGTVEGANGLGGEISQRYVCVMAFVNGDTFRLVSIDLDGETIAADGEMVDRIRGGQ